MKTFFPSAKKKKEGVFARPYKKRSIGTSSFKRPRTIYFNARAPLMLAMGNVSWVMYRR